MNTLHLYRWGMRLLPRVPERVLYALCDGGAVVVWLAVPAIRRGVAANLRHIQPAVGGWRRWLLAWRVVGYALRHYADMLRLPTFNQAYLEERFELTGIEHLDQVVAGGIGGIMAVPHCGSFSTVLAFLVGRGYPLVLVVEPIEPPELLQLISELRRSPGLEVLTLSPTAGRDVLRALRANKIVVLAGDRDLAAQPMRLPFFGTPANVPSGIARLAIRGTPVVTAFTAWAAGGQAFARIDPVLHLAQIKGESSEAATERAVLAILARLESYIGAFPASWGVLQPVWGAIAQESRIGDQGSTDSINPSQ